MNAYTFRTAREEDLDFLVNAMVEAERSGTEASSYERVIGLDDAAFRAFLRKLLQVGVPGSELHLDAYHVVQNGAGPIGAVAGWIEGEGDQSSGYRKAPAMANVLGMDRWMEVQSVVRNVELPDIPREPGTLQIDALYIRPEARGKGLAAQVITRCIEHHKQQNPTLAKVQGLSLIENHSSRQAFLKAGFAEVKQAVSDNPEIGRYMPGTGRVLWEKTL